MSKKIWNKYILPLFWPEICPFCGRVSRNGICKTCREELERIRIREPRCMRCGKPLRRPEQEYCFDCEQTVHAFDRGYSLWLHKGPVKQSVYQFKYHNQRRFAVYYAAEMTEAFFPAVSLWKPDLLIPIPLHKKRIKKRGFNQSLLIAEELGKRMSLPVDAKSLVRNKDTSPQKILDPAGRKRNLEQAFSVRDTFVPVPAVLLVDDIYTTGNTLDAAAKKLKEKGVQKVYFLTISIGQGY